MAWLRQFKTKMRGGQQTEFVFKVAWLTRAFEHLDLYQTFQSGRERFQFPIIVVRFADQWFLVLTTNRPVNATDIAIAIPK